LRISQEANPIGHALHAQSLRILHHGRRYALMQRPHVLLSMLIRQSLMCMFWHMRPAALWSMPLAADSGASIFANQPGSQSNTHTPLCAEIKNTAQRSSLRIDAASSCKNYSPCLYDSRWIACFGHMRPAAPLVDGLAADSGASIFCESARKFRWSMLCH